MTRDSKPYTILVIEDNPGDYILVEDYLIEQIANPEIVHAEDFAKAVAILSGNKEFDIVLLDLTLPDKRGQELITEMLRLVIDCPIVILTGYSDLELSIQFIAQGISDYLLKDDLNGTSLYKSIIYAIERKKNIDQLKESERRYSDLFHLNQQPMWFYDVDSLKITQVNKAAIDHYGYSEEEFLSLTILDIRPQDEVLKAKAYIDSIKATKQSTNNGKLFFHQKKSGEIIEVEIHSTPIMINNTQHRSVIAIDITEKKFNEQKIMKTIIKTQEDERYEIGGELHDNVGQILATSLINLRMLKKSVPPQGVLWFEQCKENINLAIKDIRNLSHRIAPKFFDDTTLEEAIKRLFHTFNVGEKFTIALCFDEEVKTRLVNLDIQLNIYRILQEQLKNILKYANATLIEVDVVIVNNKLKMTVVDNGAGLDVSKVRSGIGFANMKRRAELFSGKFEVLSTIGNGCTIQVLIPL